MKNFVKIVLLCSLGLTACSLTPEQQAAKEAKRIRAEQALQLRLARQCDAEAADLMAAQFNPPLNQSKDARQQFEERYAEKVNNPVFQACYKLALENYKAQEELSFLRERYEWDDLPRWRRFCRLCW